ncbi:MAG: tetratricopeptide repeat protein, partial [Gemmatimonadota bacterium]
MRDPWPSRRLWPGFVLAATVVLAPHALDAAQQKCRWPGSMWATSANLYLDRARSNPDFQEQRDLFQKTLEVSLDGIGKDADNTQHYARAGEGYVGLGDLAGADSMLTKAEELAPACKEEIEKIRYNAWAAAFNAGVGHLRSGDTEKAIDQFERASAIYQGRPEAFLQLGSLYARKAQDLQLQNGDGAKARADSLTERAMAAYRQAIEVAKEPDHQEIAAFNLAQLLAINDRYEAAVDAYRAYLESNPDHVIARTNLGIMLLRLADHVEPQNNPQAKARAEAARAEAKELYGELSMRPDLTVDDLRLVGSGLLTLGDYAAAAATFGLLLEERPYDYDALVNLANSYYLADQPDSLLPVAKKLVELYPNQGNPMAYLAHAHRELGDTRMALKVLEEREAMKVEVQDLDARFDAQANSLTVTGRIQNRSLAPGTPVGLRLE